MLKKGPLKIKERRTTTRGLYRFFGIPFKNPKNITQLMPEYFSEFIELLRKNKKL